MQRTFVSGTTPIRIQCSEPITPKGRPAVVILHGAGGNTAHWLDRIAPFVAGLGVALYAPHYFDRTRTERADNATILDGVHVPLWLETVSDCLDWVRRRPNVDPERIALLGISLGAFLALAHAATRKGVRAVVEISGGMVEPYASRAGSDFPPALLLHGELDQVVPVEQARMLERRLMALGTTCERLILPGEGHWFSQGAQLQMLGKIAQFLGRYL